MTTLSAAPDAGPQPEITVDVTFADLPKEILELRYDDSIHRQAVKAERHPVANSNTPSDSTPIDATLSHTTLSGTTSTTPSTAHSTAFSHVVGRRKPSPGLAARLKALGLGNQRKSSSPPPHHLVDAAVGRLSEEQIRKIEQSYQANTSVTALERRGRPWTGVMARLPSRASLSSFSTIDERRLESVSAHGDVEKPILPEIVSTKPLDMDTDTYRLPDDANGNGVKAQLEPRVEHITRDASPPRPQDDANIPPPPPPKDTPPPTPRDASPSGTAPDVFSPGSYFNALGRPGSVYTISRASFANQLAQLTSIQLPDAESLSSQVSAIPRAQLATRALINAAEQIRGWIYKASEVIGGLEGDDDAEWAAAGGREGVEEVELALERFQGLILVYVSAIEELQGRPDIAEVTSEDLNKAVAQMEAIIGEWAKIRSTLQNVKAQVEIAMEFEELWNMVLGDIQDELEELRRLVFEMEERRHKSIMAAASGDGVDIGDLETIVEETPSYTVRRQAITNRFSLPAALPTSPDSPCASAGMTVDDSSLLALFARMQPLRASLDFLPMRLSSFEARAKKIFPTACEELTMRRGALDATYKVLERDAESLRKELGEDRWVMVFRGAGRQAQKMYDSVERSVAKLKEAVDAGMHLTNPPTMSKKMESFEAKKTHYGPAIERVLSIIDKGVKERLTLNGEILRLNNEMKSKWAELKERIAEMDVVLDGMHGDKGRQQLRDSISSMLSNDRSTVASGIDTPGSSPPSSVVMSSLGFRKSTGTSKPRAVSMGKQTSPPGAIPRKPLTPRLVALSTPNSRAGSATPMGSHSRPASGTSGKPRWSVPTNTAALDTGHNFKPLTLTTPSPYARGPLPNVRHVSTSPLSPSKLPKLRSSLARAAASSPLCETATSAAANATPSSRPSRLASRFASFRDRISSSSPGPYAQQTLTPPSTTSGRPRQASLGLDGDLRRVSIGTPSASSKPGGHSRPASSMSLAGANSGRRSSLLPQPRPKDSMSSPLGRDSPFMRKNSVPEKATTDNRPKWR